MVEFMWTVFIGNLFMFAMVIFVIGLMFVLRVMLNIWFDTDFMHKVCAWFKAADNKLKAKKEKRIAEEKENERTLLIIDEGEEDVFEQE